MNVDYDALGEVEPSQLGSLNDTQLLAILGMSREEAVKVGLGASGAMRGALLAVRRLAAEPIPVTPAIAVEAVPEVPGEAPITISRREHARRMNAERNRLRTAAFEAKETYSWCSSADEVIQAAGLNDVDAAASVRADIVIRIPVEFEPYDAVTRELVDEGDPVAALARLEAQGDRVYQVALNSRYLEDGNQLIATADYQLRGSFGIQNSGGGWIPARATGVRAQVHVENLRIIQEE